MKAAKTKNRLALLLLLTATVFFAGCVILNKDTSDRVAQQYVIGSLCGQFELNPEPGTAMERNICTPTPNGIVVHDSLAWLVEEYYDGLNPVDRGLLDMLQPDYTTVVTDAWSAWVVENITGAEQFDQNTVLNISCSKNYHPNDWLKTGFPAPVMGINTQIIENCGANGKSCASPDPATKKTELPDGNQMTAICVAPPAIPAPLGKFLECNTEQKKCEEKNCGLVDINQMKMEGKLQEFCSNLPNVIKASGPCIGNTLVDVCTKKTNEEDITQLSVTAECLRPLCTVLATGGCTASRQDCPVGPPLQQSNCALDCANGQAWQIPCGQWVPSNLTQEQYAACFTDPNQQPLCQGGNIGALCGNNEYCDNSGGAWQCKPISAALCDTKPASNPGESGLPLVNGNANCSSGKTEGKYGIKCASGICDIEGNEGQGAGACISPELSADSPDYEYSIGGNNSADEKGIGINFKPVANTAYNYPQFCAPTVFCPSCSDQLIEIKDLEEGLAFSFNKIKAKGGILRFKMSARGASGQDNYARIQYNDVQSDGQAKKVKSEQFIVEVDAPQIGECSLESGENIIGDNGNKAKTLLKYNWDFGKSETIGPGFCEIIDGSTTQKPYVCDATQFTISLMKRLNKIKTHYGVGTPSEIAAGNALRDFNVLLMTDSFNQNFRDNFTQYYTSAAFADTPSWFGSEGDGFKKYLGGTASGHLVFTPDSVSRPGKYRVFIDLAGGTQFFAADHSPALTITIGFMPLPTPNSINMDNALYYLPVDGGVTDSATTNRNGYGIGTGTETGTIIDVPFKTDFGSLQASGGLRSVAGQTLSAFAQTNLRDNRGRILQVKLVFEGDDPKQLVKAAEPSIVLYAPIMATPVAIKIPENESLIDGTHFAKYEIVNASPPSENQELTGWTGLAASQRNAADPPCSDFVGNPLASKVNDAPTGEGAVRALSFLKETISSQPKFLVFGSVFYAPRQDSVPGLKTLQDGLQLLTPNEATTNPSASVSLNYTDDPSKFSYYSAHGLRIAYLQDLMDIVNANQNADTGPICMVTKKQMDGGKVKSIETVYYWNRGILLNELLEKDSTMLAPPGSNNDITQFSVTEAMRCN